MVSVDESVAHDSQQEAPDMVTSPLVQRLASGAPLGDPPAVIDIHGTTPPNPPEQLQMQFVGLSFEKAYSEAETFVSAVEQSLRAAGHPGLADSKVFDFGSGWGRISRVLLTKVAPERLFAADVDRDMTALVNVSLPGINAMTVTPMPPTVLGTGSMDVAVAFSVFSHLSGAAHEAWAHEIGRLVRPGGIVAVTVLGEDFINVVAGAQEAVARGEADDFSASMADVFPDVAAARAGFHSDQVQFGATGGGGVRTSDYYGWAAASRGCVERIWGEAGMDLVRWEPAHQLFPQALAVLVRREDADSGKATQRARRVIGRVAGQAAHQARTRLPRPVVDAARRVLRP
jgi:SAM-dependent methyltransferase